jgi:hypothetical protein
VKRIGSTGGTAAEAAVTRGTWKRQQTPMTEEKYGNDTGLAAGDGVGGGVKKKMEEAAMQEGETKQFCIKGEKIYMELFPYFKFLISALESSFTTCQTSVHIKGINGANLNRAKSNSEYKLA